ncbi:acetylserotonin O-methyltransferase-like [Ptychodera flava]|uniref:acetylserotonin O-methyltransferase-like n=1 Tax=Ptychodera flava TaxID=63121 RepID=UPI00396A8F78
MDGMHGLSLATSPSVVKAFDFSEFKTVCDFGGGTGALAYELCRVYPEMSIKVLELPPVAKVAAKYFEPKDGKSAKVEFVPGDFFEKELPAADMYIFSQVFHNWQEDKIHQLLKKAHKALKPGGAVLLVEHLFNNDKTGPPPVAVRCLLMLLGSEGRERNKEEYTKLLEVNGFKDVQFKPSGVLQTAILARRL